MKGEAPIIGLVILAVLVFFLSGMASVVQVETGWKSGISGTPAQYIKDFTLVNTNEPGCNIGTVTCESDRCVVRYLQCEKGPGPYKQCYGVYKYQWIMDKGDTFKTYVTDPYENLMNCIYIDNYKLKEDVCPSTPTEWSSCNEETQTRYEFSYDYTKNECITKLVEKPCKTIISEPSPENPKSWTELEEPTKEVPTEELPKLTLTQRISNWFTSIIDKLKSFIYK